MPGTSRSRGLPLPEFRHLVLMFLVAGTGWLVWRSFDARRQEENFHNPASSSAERIQSLEAFVAQGGAAVPKLVEFLSDPDTKVRRNAAMGLGRIGPAARDAVPALERVLDDADSQVRDNAVWALGRIGCDLERLVPRLVTLLTDQDDRVSAGAAEILARVGSAAVPEIMRVIDRFPAGRAGRGLAFIAQFGKDVPEAVATVRRIFRDRERELAMRESAFAALVILGETTDEDLRHAIRHRLDDPQATIKRQWSVYYRAFVRRRDLTSTGLAIAQRPVCETAQFLPDILELLDRPDAPVLDALASIGPAAGAAIPRLLEIADRASVSLVPHAETDDGAPETVDPQLRQRMERTDSEELRLRAIRTAWRLGAERDSLVRLLTEITFEDERIDLEAVHLLREISPADARRLVPRGIEMLNSESRNAHARGARLLAALGPEAAAAVPRLIDELQSVKFPDEGKPYSPDEGKLYSVLIAAVGSIGEPAKGAVPILCDILRTADPLKRRGEIEAIARALGQLGPAAADAVPALVELFDRCSRAEAANPKHSEQRFDVGVAGVVLCALGDIGVSNADVRARVEAALDSDVTARSAGVYACVRLEPDEERVTALLAEALQDPGFILVFQTITALAERGAHSEKTLALLVDVLEDEDKSAFIRQAAVQALARLGGDLRVAVPALRAALERRQPEVRNSENTRIPASLTLDDIDWRFTSTPESRLERAILEFLQELEASVQGADAPRSPSE